MCSIAISVQPHHQFTISYIVVACRVQCTFESESHLLHNRGIREVLNDLKSIVWTWSSKLIRV